MSLKSRIKTEAAKEISLLRDALNNLPHGGLSLLCEATGVNRSAINRIKNGKEVSSTKFKTLEVAIKSTTQG